MKRILFVCNNLNHGGIPKALVNLLKEIEGQYGVDLLLFYPEGDYLDEIPASVRLLPSEGWLPLLGTPQNVLKKQSAGKAMLRAVLVLWSRLFRNKWPRKWVFATVPPLSGYDAAVSYAQDNSDKAFAIGCNSFVLQKVEAERKIAFVHCDFEHYGGNTPGNREEYRHFDRIACVSEGCRGAFLRVLPELKDRTLVVRNCTDYAAVAAMGEKSECVFPGKGFHMVSVSRLNPEKGFFRALKAVEPVMKNHPELYWHIIGDGPERERFRQAIQAAGLADRVLLLGAKRNPYPYMKQGDLLFLPSFHEAAPMVFDEAKVLKLPVFTTDTLSAGQLVGEAGIGVVCANMEEAICQGLQEILEQPEGLTALRQHLGEIRPDNKEAVIGWERLISDGCEVKCDCDGL